MKKKKFFYSKLKDDDPLRSAEGIFNGVLLGGLVWLLLLVIILLSFGCATGAKKTAEEPLHAELGAGITIWKVPILGFGGWGGDSYGRVPDIIIHRYDYTVKPPPTPPGAPPTPPTAIPPAADYQTIYSSVYDDPSLVIFNNKSYRNIKITIDGQSPIRLEPYRSTSNLHLGQGDHRTVIEIERPTAAHGIWTTTRSFTIRVRPEGRSQIFDIYDDNGYYRYRRYWR